jgi:hypothetical protein
MVNIFFAPLTPIYPLQYPDHIANNMPDARGWVMETVGSLYPKGKIGDSEIYLARKNSSIGTYVLTPAAITSSDRGAKQ